MKSLLIFLFCSVSVFTNGQYDSLKLSQNYDLHHYRIPMRDGAELFTIVYTPKDTTQDYPFLMNRTCYNASRNDNYRIGSQPSGYLIDDGYIMVFQDVRGRYMSDGKFDNMRPNIPGKKGIDESSDTYDTINWLLKNINHNNGKVGMLGISYPGFYTAAALPDAHPALVASSPQAPIADFFFDDFHHHGAYLQSYTPAFAVFGYQKDSLTTSSWYKEKISRFYNDSMPTDGYEFYLNLGPLSNITEQYHYDNFFWQQIISHPNYDEFWQKRNLLPHLNNIDHAVMTVGGWYDAEDLYGPLNIYKTIESNCEDANNTIVMGPWTHGAWAREPGSQTVNHIYYGDSISTYYQREIELPFFRSNLKGETSSGRPEAHMFDTGIKEWKSFDSWPADNLRTHRCNIGKNKSLLIDSKSFDKHNYSYISDPSNPVPYRSETEGLTFTPRLFITDDQRHVADRSDVLTLTSDVLNEDLTIGGEILAHLVVSTTGTDADFVVKLIDVYPDDHEDYDHNPPEIEMGGYQQLVRHEVFRGRFRDSYESPKPFVPDQKTIVDVPLQDILHTFKKGHKVMIQIHSTWFPYIDRNPQKYVENIYEAKESDFIESTIIIYGESYVELGGSCHNKNSNQ